MSAWQKSQSCRVILKLIFDLATPPIKVIFYDDLLSLYYLFSKESSKILDTYHETQEPKFDLNFWQNQLQ